MKKIATTLGMLTLCSSFSSQADTILGLYAGAQGWNMETEGGYSRDGDNRDFNFEDETKGSFYVAFEHPIPLIPNIKLQKTEMDTQGDITLEQQFDFGVQTFTTGSTLNTDVSLSSTDAILYYEFFDNDLISFDFGVNIKYLEGELLVVDTDQPTRTGYEDFSGPVPMLYSKLQLGLPFTGFGAFVEGSYLSIDDHSLTDYQAAITYSLMENLALDVTFQAGYRAFTLELEDLDDIYSDLEFKGVFAGIEVHF
ncbi:TIGR04219 family outer membrane beta-barrel protein [Paraglaciecola aquimarina]|uniref:TIGR04219 family outer membrane beta-barrel protein n=1 Tax=Paraglaciecola aquimarina TaxID=1235557 RepID=A0ABU3STA6_9ALTE|nr:TIGR04219 family outer membrane beta-barrel protein [Paraglaciecola aquimarina]MDU0353202.1 TIGR04219 family outer membrane beta-barrel protein [Paraglaciecola aquimarina]